MNDTKQKLPSIFQDLELGIGTWQWGDRLYWGYGTHYDEDTLREAFISCLDHGIRFFDTSEVFGMGKSETLLGRFLSETELKTIIATKFMPFPWRLRKSSLIKALKKSISRLNREYIDLYQIHMSLPPLTIETWMDAMLDAYQIGLVKTIGVANFDRSQMQRAYDALIRQGVRLNSNQVEYNLLNRSIEKNGLLKHCQDLNIALIAYSPLSQGVLSGKYSIDTPPSGMRGRRYNRKFMEKIEPLVKAMKKIGADHAGKTCAQVALNWIICKGAFPIPGIKNIEQVEENSGAGGWELTDEEISRLDLMSDQISENLN